MRAGAFCKAAISLKMRGLMAMFEQCLLVAGFGRPDRESTAAGFARFDWESGLAGFDRSDQESWLADFGRFDHYRVKQNYRQMLLSYRLIRNVWDDTFIFML